MKVDGWDEKGLLLLTPALCREGFGPLGSWHALCFYLYFNLITKHYGFPCHKAQLWCCSLHSRLWAFIFKHVYSNSHCTGRERIFMVRGWV